MQVSYGGLLVRWSMPNPAFRRSLRSVGRNGSVNDDNGSTWKLRFSPSALTKGRPFLNEGSALLKQKDVPFPDKARFFMFSFAHTEVPEDGAQDLVGGDGTSCDLGEVEEALAEVPGTDAGRLEVLNDA